MVLRVVACDPAEDVDCAILELPMGQEGRPFLAPWEGDAALLTGRIDFVLASTIRGQLCFSEAPISVVSNDLTSVLYCSATSAGNGGALSSTGMEGSSDFTRPRLRRRECRRVVKV